MKRRTLLAGVAGSTAAASAGCLDRFTEDEPSVDPEIELVDPDLAFEDPPEVSVDGGAVAVRGTVRYGSSACGTVELAHAAYEESQARLDLLVVAADGENGPERCTDDLVDSGYRIEATAEDGLRRITATEHHVFGETHSTTVELTD